MLTQDFEAAARQLARSISHQDCDDEEGLLGTVLVAHEGYNGTLAGPENSVRDVLAWIEQRLLPDTGIDGRWTDADSAPFRRMRVRLKKEIVTLGRPDILPHEKSGIHVPAEEWNDLIDDPNMLVIDARNHYEVELGTFSGPASVPLYPSWATRTVPSSPVSAKRRASIDDLRTALA